MPGYRDTAAGRREREWVHTLPPITEPNLACGTCGCDEPPVYRAKVSKKGQVLCCAGCHRPWDSCPDADQIERRCAEINASRPQFTRQYCRDSGIKVCKLIIRKRTKIKGDR